MRKERIVKMWRGGGNCRFSAGKRSEIVQGRGIGKYFDYFQILYGIILDAIFAITLFGYGVIVS